MKHILCLTKETPKQINKQTFPENRAREKRKIPTKKEQNVRDDRRLRMLLMFLMEEVEVAHKMIPLKMFAWTFKAVFDVKRKLLSLPPEGV